MHTFERIHKEIDVIDGGTFQVLAQRCCLRKYGFKSAHYYGTRAGSVKTTTGHPDSSYETDTGGWAFLEAGHIAEHAQAKAKIQSDIDEAMIHSLNISLDHRGNLIRVEKLLCFLLASSTSYWYGEKLCLCVIEKDPAFIKEFLRTWIECDSKAHISFEQDIGKLFWKTHDPMNALSMLPEVQKELPADSTLSFYLTRCVLSIVKIGINKEHRIDLIEWLSSEATSQSPFSEIAIDAGTSLDYEDRANFCVALCEKTLP